MQNAYKLRHTHTNTHTAYAPRIGIINFSVEKPEGSAREKEDTNEEKKNIEWNRRRDDVKMQRG